VVLCWARYSCWREIVLPPVRLGPYSPEQLLHSLFRLPNRLFQTAPRVGRLPFLVDALVVRVTRREIAQRAVRHAQDDERGIGEFCAQRFLERRVQLVRRGD